MRLSRVLRLVVLSVFVSAHAEAVPMKVSFATIVDGNDPSDPLDGLALSGFFVYDDPFGTEGCSPSCVDTRAEFPLLDFLLNIDVYRFDLSDLHPRSSVYGPLGSRFWGPLVGIFDPPPGLIGLGFGSGGTGGGTVTLFYAWGVDDSNEFQVPFVITQVSVPEPGSLTWSLAALAAVAMRLRPFRNSNEARRWTS